MDTFINITGSVLTALIMLSIMVVFHEGGHFLAAKAVGVKVNEFSIGMGKLIYEKKKGETKYSIRIFIIGGFVAMEGEDQESEDERAFNKKPVWAKILILAAGPFMNFVLAVLIFICLIMITGTSASNTVYSVAENTAAYEAGIMPGDIITAVGDIPVSGGAEINAALSEAVQNAEISASGGSVDIVFTYIDHAAGEEKTAEAKLIPDENNNIRVGIVFEAKRDILSAVRLGIVNSAVMEARMLESLISIFSGGVSINDFVGPVGIIKIVSETAQVGALNLFYLMALLSLNLGLVNILPFPGLDGGRLLFAVIRTVTGRMISDKTENMIHFAGMMVLFSLMIFITLKDIHSLI